MSRLWDKGDPLDRGVLARALRAIDGMGAEAIGFDIERQKFGFFFPVNKGPEDLSNRM